MPDRCENHLKYSCVKKRTHRHFHDFHLALYLCHYKTCFCGMHNQGAEHLVKSRYSKTSIKLNMIVVIFFFFSLFFLTTRNSWITLWLAIILTMSDTCWNNGFRLTRWRGRERSWSPLVVSWGRGACDGGYLGDGKMAFWVTLEITQALPVTGFVCSLFLLFQ